METIIAGKSELAVFDPPVIQTAIENTSFQDVFPAYTPTPTNLEFVIRGSNDYYLDLNDTLLYLKIKLTRPAAYAPAAEAEEPHENVLRQNCFIENLPIATLFTKVSLYLNDTLVEGSHSLYPYKAMLLTMLQYSEPAKLKQLRAWGYGKDSVRKAWMDKDDTTLEFVGPLFLDFFLQPQLLIPTVDVRIHLTRNQQSQFFMRTNAGETWGLSLESAMMKVKKVQVNKSIYQAHSLGILRQNALYPFRRTLLVSHSVAQGATSHSIDNVFRGHSPKAIITVMVKDSATTTITSDPFTFEPFHLNYFALSRDGVILPNLRAFTPDFDLGLCMNEYASLFQALQIFTQNQTIDVTFEEFKTNKCIFLTNLCPDMDLENTQPTHISNLRLEMKFSEALAQNINIIMMAICDDVLEIDKSSRVFCRF